ncbi:PA2778 family cysteine peptidase [Pseudomonas sp.]|uniref:PA2778 family cysteine peptidase n=1 Tax=Pseudomonas sp. TaxID=306 RepID=UPI0027355CD5|nr:PA2778 family cysteine peptidase [Pseudomonas sp.]MDP3814586.1 PA2778 family cysteine peptidase [Pseudomonas sp.]
MASLLLLAACARVPLAPETLRLPERVELSDVPFFQQSDAQGGASALAALLNHHGVISSPGLLEQRIQQAGAVTPQTGLEFAARSHDLLVYPVEANFDALLQQVAAGHPVLVLQHKTLAWPGAQFAVLVGYDKREQTLVLRSGNTRRGYTRFASFDSAWEEAGRWAVVLAPADQLPAQPQLNTWLQAAEALRKQGRDEAAQRALRTARKQWPAAGL